MSLVRRAGRPAILRGKNFNIGHYMQTVPPNVFIPAMLIGTTDFYHFIPLSLSLTLPGGHSISTKQKPIGFIFLNTFHLIMIKFDVVTTQFKPNILRLLLIKIC